MDSYTDEVKYQIHNNPLLKDENVLVKSVGDRIVLKGHVSSLDKKWLVEDIVREAFGDLDVTNEIQVSNLFEDEQREVFYEGF